MYEPRESQMAVDSHICMCLPTTEQILFEEMTDCILFCLQMYNNRYHQCSNHVPVNMGEKVINEEWCIKHNDSTLKLWFHKRLIKQLKANWCWAKEGCIKHNDSTLKLWFHNRLTNPLKANWCWAKEGFAMKI